MKKILYIVALAVFSIPGLQAQVIPERENEGSNRAAKASHRSHIYRDLDFTKEQQRKLKNLQKETRSSMNSIRNDTALSPAQKKVTYTELKKAQQEKRDAILTPQQKNKMLAQTMAMTQKERNSVTTKYRKAENGDGNGFRKSRNTSNRDYWKKELNLNAEQQTKMQALHKEMSNKMQAVKTNASLNQQQKIAATKALQRERQLKRRNILTPQQQASWEAHQKRTRKAHHRINNPEEKI